MKTLKDVKVGDRVLLVGSTPFSEKRKRAPEEREVVKVGRTLLHVDTPDASYPSPSTYRIENGRANDGYGHSSICTRDEYEHEQRQAEAAEEMHRLGVEVRLGRRLTLEQTEAVVAALRATGAEERS